MNSFRRRFPALTLGILALGGTLAGCQPRRPVPTDIRLHHNEAIIPRNDDLFPDGDLFLAPTPAGNQAFNRNRRRDQKRRAERREAGRNRKSLIGERKKQRSGGRKRGG